jgi:hypothetical protein
MPYSENEVAYGPVRVSRGKHKGRIGEFDNDTYHRGRPTAVVKFCHPLVTAFYCLIPIEYLEPVNTQHLLHRLQELFEILSPYKRDEQDPQKRVEALEEFAYVSDLLNDRMFSAQFERSPRGARVFISHSSQDKSFVKGLAVDLAAKGHQPWVDEWEILAGESIPERISNGIEDADFVLVVLSRASVESKWVEQEWQSKYWSEVNERHIQVIPVLVNDCEIPTLLRHKKYVDFRDDYTSALELLAKSLAKLLERKVGA